MLQFIIYSKMPIIHGKSVKWLKKDKNQDTKGFE